MQRSLKTLCVTGLWLRLHVQDNSGSHHEVLSLCLELFAW